MYLANGENLNHQIRSSIAVRKCLREGPKQIQIIGDPNKERPEKLRSTVQYTLL